MENAMQYSEHAKRRMQQRGIKRDVVEMLLQIGKRSRCAKGAFIIHMNKECRMKIPNGTVSKSKKYLEENSIYVIQKGNSILTVGHRYKRIKTV